MAKEKKTRSIWLLYEGLTGYTSYGNAVDERPTVWRLMTMLLQLQGCWRLFAIATVGNQSLQPTHFGFFISVCVYPWHTDALYFDYLSQSDKCFSNVPSLRARERHTFASSMMNTFIRQNDRKRQTGRQTGREHKRTHRIHKTTTT